MFWRKERPQQQRPLGSALCELEAALVTLRETSALVDREVALLRTEVAIAAAVEIEKDKPDD